MWMLWQWATVGVISMWCAALTWIVLKHIGKPTAGAHPVSTELLPLPYADDIFRDMRDPAARLAIEEIGEQLRQVRAKVDKIDGRLEPTWSADRASYFWWIVRDVTSLRDDVARLERLAGIHSLGARNVVLRSAEEVAADPRYRAPPSDGDAGGQYGDDR